nr:ADP-ribosylation factor-like protein [Candidatus Sigynarchaeota archaeon]
MTETTTEAAKKIIFTGLDNSGKTSILLTLEAEKYIKANLKPTTFVDRKEFKFLDYIISTHDLGGQKKYLIKYLKQPDKYFAGTDICIYVIDVQDLARYNETLEYAKDLLTQFDVLNIKPKIYVFFHKAENMLNGDLQLAKNVEMLQDRLLDINNGRFKMEFENTTIYDAFTITSTFSTILQDLYPRDVLVQKTMKEFAERLNAVAVVLFDRRILTIADYFQDPKYKDVAQFCATYMQTFQSSVSRFPGVQATRLKFEVETFETMFQENVSDPKTYLFLLGTKGSLPTLDQISKEISAILPELFVSLRIALKSE